VENIDEAARCVDPAFLNSPQVIDASMTRRIGGELILKLETFNPVRCFKGRGAELAPLEPEVIFVPVGNGALISGIGCWMKARSPGTRIVGVCAAGAPAMAESWRRGSLVTSAEVATIADGVAVRVPIPAALGWMAELVDDMILIDDAQLRKALRIARDTIGLILEPSGALGIAAALHHRIPGSRPATIVTGSNFSAELLAELTKL
jgi:threonine dehydratase